MGKNRTLYLADFCLTPHINIPNAGILCESGKIIGIGGVSAFSQDEPNLEAALAHTAANLRRAAASLAARPDWNAN